MIKPSTGCLKLLLHTISCYTCYSSFNHSWFFFKFSKYTSLTNFMQICPLAAAQQCHANGRQNEANSCDQHHTQESAPVTIVRGLGGPVYMSIEKIISCTCWGQTPDHPAHSKSLHQLCHPTSCLYIHNTYVINWYLNPKYKCVQIFFFWAAWWPYMVEKLNIYRLKLNI